MGDQETAPAKSQLRCAGGFSHGFLGEKITIVEQLESEGNQLSEDDKFNRVYAKALNDKGEIIIVKI